MKWPLSRGEINFRQQVKDRMDVRLDLFKKFWDSLGREIKACFFTTLMVGLFTHIYMITNKIPNWDDVSLVPQTGLGGYGGRWLSDPVANFFSEWSAPGIDGGFAIVLLAVAACFVVAALQIRSLTGAVLCGVMMVTFPSVASNMTYMYIASEHSLVILMMSMAVWLTVRYKWGWIPAVVLQILGMAIYQVHFAFAVCLFLMVLIGVILAGDGTRDTARKGLKYLVTLLLGMVGYLISIRLSGYELIDYRGMNNIGREDPVTVLHAFMRAYHRVLEYFVTNPLSYGRGVAHVLNTASVLIVVVLAAFLIFHRKIYQSALNLFMYLIFLALMPLGMGLCYVMSVETQQASSNMIYQFVCLYLLLIVLCEHLERGQGRMAGTTVVLSLLSVAILVSVGYTNYRIDNEAYYRSYIAQQRIYGLYNRIAARLEEQPGYQYNDKVLILGDWWPDPNPLSACNMDADTYVDLEGMPDEHGLFTEGIRNKYMRIFLGVDNQLYYGPSVDLGSEIKKTAEYQKMGSWPATDCIRQFETRDNGAVWVVKIADEAQ